MTWRVTAAGVFAAGVLLTGCQSTVIGNPQGSDGNAGEPTFPTSRRSSATPPVPSLAPETPTAAAPPPTAEALPPLNGYVFIATKSGRTRCQISDAEVGCEAPFVDAPVVDGAPANGVRVTAAGQLRWVLGNLGDIPAVTIDYRSYTAQGWSIAAGETGTRFTNDRTGHGMFVAVNGAEAF